MSPRAMITLANTLLKEFSLQENSSLIQVVVLVLFLLVKPIIFIEKLELR